MGKRRKQQTKTGKKSKRAAGGEKGFAAQLAQVTLPLPTQELPLPGDYEAEPMDLERLALDDDAMLAFWEAEEADNPVLKRNDQKQTSRTPPPAISPSPTPQVVPDSAEILALQAKLATLQQRCQALDDECARLGQELLGKSDEAAEEKRRSERFLQERDEARKKYTALDGRLVSLEEAFLQRGLPTPLHGEALVALASADTAALVSMLSVDTEGISALLQRSVALCCGREECATELTLASGVQLLRVTDEKRCENCRGSDNRRAFRRMVRMCKERRIYKMIVVGGSPDAHTELTQLTPDGFIQRIVTGKERRNKQQATEDLRHADLLVVWGPTILPHKISELYTKQREAFPNKVALVLKRGVASFAREVCHFLEELEG